MVTSQIVGLDVTIVAIIALMSVNKDQNSDINSQRNDNYNTGNFNTALFSFNKSFILFIFALNKFNGINNIISLLQNVELEDLSRFMTPIKFGDRK